MQLALGMTPKFYIFTVKGEVFIKTSPEIMGWFSDEFEIVTKH